jgi:hypothetical protein
MQLQHPKMYSKPGQEQSEVCSRSHLHQCSATWTKKCELAYICLKAWREKSNFKLQCKINTCAKQIATVKQDSILCAIFGLLFNFITPALGPGPDCPAWAACTRSLWTVTVDLTGTLFEISVVRRRLADLHKSLGQPAGPCSCKLSKRN